jgi:hypothetical protein
MRHFFSPSRFPSASYKGTQINLETPSPELSIVGVNLSKHFKDLMGPQKLCASANDGETQLVDMAYSLFFIFFAVFSFYELAKVAVSLHRVQISGNNKMRRDQ